MSRTSRVPGRIVSYLLVAAALLLTACMGYDDGTADDTAAQTSAIVYPVDRRLPARAWPAREHNGEPATTVAISDPPLGRLLVDVQITCYDGMATIAAQTTKPADEIEVRTLPMVRPGKIGWYQVRETYPLEPLLRAPESTTYPSWTRVPFDGTCEDFRAQLDDARAVFGDELQTFSLR